MAEQKLTDRQIATPTTSFTGLAGYTQLSQAVNAVGGAVTDTLNAVAIDKAATQGTLDVADGVQPKELATPLTAATKAYNNAVIQEEARSVLYSARDIVAQALNETKDPSKFNEKSPLEFAAKLQGIEEGILKNTRDENRAKIKEGLANLFFKAKEDITEHAIKYDNARLQDDFKNKLQTILEEKRNASVAGDNSLVAAKNQEALEVLENYSNMSQQIADIKEQIKRTLDKSNEIDNIINDYAHSVTNGSDDEFLSNLSKRKDIPYDVLQQATLDIVKIKNAHAQLNNDMNARELAAVKRNIDNGTITNPLEIGGYNSLTEPQKIGLEALLFQKQYTSASQQQKLAAAQRDILTGYGGFVSSATKNEMFDYALENFRTSTGAQPTLIDMADMILGKSVTPVSGMVDTPVGSSVPKFDGLLNNYLVKGNPQNVAMAASTYNYMNDTMKGGANVDVNGDAMAVLQTYNALSQGGGLAPLDAADLAIKTVRETSQHERDLRLENYKKVYNKPVATNSVYDKSQQLYKDTFGVWPSKTNNYSSYNVFKETFKAYFLATGSEDIALSATKQSMRNFRESEWYEPGYRTANAPESEVPISKMGYSFGNQLAFNVNSVIENNQATREQGYKVPVVEWADKEFKLPKDLSETDRVYSQLVKGKPRIKVDGIESEVVLMDSPTSRMGNGITYTLGYYDKFGVLVPIPTQDNVTMTAQFRPTSFDIWAPQLAIDAQNKQDLETAQRTYAEKKYQEDYLPLIFRPARALNQLLSRSGEDTFTTFTKNLEKSNSKEKEINKIFNDIQSARNSATQAEAAANSVVKGISLDPESFLNE